MTSAGREHISDVLMMHRGSLPAEPPLRIHVAPIATGNNVMRDPFLFERLSDSMRDVLGVEMEAASIAAIAHSRRLRWVVMKAAMDFADHDKDDQFKPFAARASAECLVAFLRQYLLAPDHHTAQPLVQIASSAGDAVKLASAGPASEVKTPASASPISSRKEMAVQNKSIRYVDEVREQLLSAFAGRVAVVRGLPNMRVDMLLDLRTAEPKGAQHHLGVVLLDETAKVERLGFGWPGLQ